MSTFYKTSPDTKAFGLVPAYRKYELYQARYHELAPVVRQMISATPGPRILDIGAGMGEAKIFCDALAGPAEWTAVEINPERVMRCKALGYARVVDTVDLEAQPLPFPDATFDVVIASHVLEHLNNAPAALDDWFRVLKPNGSLILGLPMHLGFVAALARLKYRIRGRKPYGHCQFFSMNTLRKFLTGRSIERIWGFRIVSARSQLPLEDWEWFYRASIWLGARVPGICAEVNVHLVKRVPS